MGVGREEAMAEATVTEEVEREEATAAREERVGWVVEQGATMDKSICTLCLLNNWQTRIA